MNKNKKILKKLSRETKEYFLYGSKSKFCVQCNQPDGKIIPSETDIEMISKTLCCSSLSLISLFWLLCNLKFFREEMFQVLITLQTLCKCPKFYKVLQTILNKINLSWKEEIFFFLLLREKNNSTIRKKGNLQLCWIHLVLYVHGCIFCQDFLQSPKTLDS